MGVRARLTTQTRTNSSMNKLTHQTNIRDECPLFPTAYWGRTLTSIPVCSRAGFDLRLGLLCLEGKSGPHGRNQTAFAFNIGGPTMAHGGPWRAHRGPRRAHRGPRQAHLCPAHRGPRRTHRGPWWAHRGPTSGHRWPAGGLHGDNSQTLRFIHNLVLVIPCAFTQNMVLLL